MMKSSISYFVGAIGVMAGLGWAVRSNKISLGPLNKVYNADEITASQYEEMHIENYTILYYVCIIVLFICRIKWWKVRKILTSQSL